MSGTEDVSRPEVLEAARRQGRRDARAFRQADPRPAEQLSRAEHAAYVLAYAEGYLSI